MYIKELKYNIFILVDMMRIFNSFSFTQKVSYQYECLNIHWTVQMNSDYNFLSAARAYTLAIILQIQNLGDNFICNYNYV